MKIGQKLILGFTSISLLVGTVGYMSINTARRALQERIGQSSAILAMNILDNVERSIHSRIETSQKLCRDSVTRRAISESNREFEKLDDIQAYIDDQERQWISAPKEETTVFMGKALNSMLSGKLRETVDFYEDKYGFRVFAEIFMTNKYGANAALTQKTTDYYQADETWWQEAKKDGLYVGDVEYDESADVYSTAISIRIDDESGDFLGVAKYVLNIRDSVDLIRQAATREEGHVELRLLTRDRNIIYTTQASGHSEGLLENLLSHLSQGSLSASYFIAESEKPDEHTRLYAYAHSRGHKDYKGLGWILVVEHDSKEIFTPIAKLRNLILLFSAAIMALVMTIGVLINRSIATPVKILSKAVAAIGRGDLDTEVTVKTKDEIGQFAQALNTMVSDLSKITTSRDVLNQEIERRAQTEKELLLAQALSEEQLSELQEAQDASLNMFEDIDDENIKRKRAEEELKRQKANLDALFNASPFGMLLVDENGRIKRINSVAAGLVAKDAASVVNSKPGSGLGCIHSMEDVKGCGHGGFCSECPMRKAIEKVLDSGETVRGSEFEATFLVNGAEVDLWLEISAEPMNLEGSRHVIMAITNITDRKAREKELREVHEDLVLASNRAGMAEVATDVIHNVGNVLNSVNISTTMIREIISNSKVPNLKKVTGIIQEHAEDIGQFLCEDPQGKHIPAYLGKLAELLTDEQAKIGKELLGLSENVEHIKETIKMQQSYSKVAGVDMASSLGEVVENAIQINDPGLEKYGVTFVRESAELPKVSIDKQRVLQILVNLIGNAKHAVADNQEGDKVVTVRFYRHGEDRLHIQVADNGVGIPKGKLSKIFGHGFTTKENGHGFGLHSGALAAKEMGGSLTVESDGPGLGATFTLEIPFRPVRVKV